MNIIKNKKIAVIVGFSILFIVLGYFFNSEHQTEEENVMKYFTSKEEFIEYLENNQNRYNYKNSFDTLEMTVEDSSSDYSDTNVQVEGVDEDDEVLTDGEYIYTISNGDVKILNILEDGKVSINRTIDFEELTSDCETSEYGYEYCNNYTATSLYSDDEHLIVLGTYYNSFTDNYDYYEPMIDCFDCYYGGSTELMIFVYDKTNNFELLDTYSFEGYLVGTRKVNNNLYLILSEYMYYYDLLENDGEILPSYSINNSITQLDYSDIAYNTSVNFSTLNMIYGINLDTSEISHEVIASNTNNIYMTTDTLYLANNSYEYEEDLISSTYTSNTIINKYDLSNGLVTSDAFTLVKGTTINQFSMDEYQGNFRIATTERTSNYNNVIGEYNEVINNRLYILDNNLKQLSIVENLGKEGETFQSVRFDNEYVYLVTFLRTDPLYIIDVSDSSNPEILSELEINGFSTYQQKYDGNHILGIGFEADDEGLTIGLKISLFDVSDKLNPIEIHKEVIAYEDFGWSYSSATYDHKKLLLSADKGLIAFPFNSSGYDGKTREYFNNSGYLVYNIDLNKGFIENGFIEHDYDESSSYYYYSYVKKGLYINDYLYTVSNDLLIVSPLSNVENYIQTLKLSE